MIFEILATVVIVGFVVWGLSVIARAKRKCTHAFCDLVDAKPQEEPDEAQFAPQDAVVLVRRCNMCGWREAKGQVWAADRSWSWPRS